MDRSLTWACPGCGAPVRVPADSRIVGPVTVDQLHLDRVAQALCGCFVLTMTPGSLGRLLAAVLAAGEEDPSL